MNAPISRRCGVLLFLASLQVLGACQAGSSVGTAPRAKVVGSVQPSSAGLVTPGASATVAAGPAAVAIAKLLKPSANTITLSGTVRLDASQLVAQGGGTLATLGEQSVFSAGDTRLIAQGGGNLIANGGGNLIAQGGGNLIANGGGNLIAQGGGNVIVPGGVASLIAQGGGNLIAQGGGNLIANGGGNLIAQGGGNLIAQGGGNLIAQGGGNYRILSTPWVGTGSVAPDAAALAGLVSGSLVPAAGMMLGVIDLRDNRFVSLGVNAEGEAVEAVYSNLQGAYTLHVPAELKENLRVVALTPGLQGRTGIYDAVVVGEPSNDPSVNDDTTILTKYLRVAMRGKLWDILKAQTEAEKKDAAQNLVGQHNPMLPMLEKIVQNYRNTVIDAGVPPCRYFQAAVLASDTLLAYVKLSEIKPISVTNRVGCGNVFTVADKQKSALELMQPLLRETRERLSRRLQEDPQYFIKKAQDPTSYVAIANERFRFPGRSAFVITKPSDWWDLVVEGFFAGIEADQWLYSFDAFADLYPDESPEKVQERVLTFFACGAGFGLEMGKVFVFNADAQGFLKSSLPRLADGNTTPCGPQTPLPSFSPPIRTRFPCSSASDSAASAKPSPSTIPSASL